ncbi:MAG: single-stranded DNA-binding protein [Candidatus Melainabacteria bacterium HGW-Melainabacteria-1]|nr:MAG: single-stranded DNA-binding protein [Candidatus Melainabacteria bacterium HGW-Melainabacteria-1]
MSEQIQREQINTVILVGRAGRNPEIKYFESGKTLATFSLAVDRPRTSPNAEPKTDWFRIELWGRQAEIAFEYVKKGSLIGIKGKLAFRRHDDGHIEHFIYCYGLRLIGGRHDIAPPKGDAEPF